MTEELLDVLEDLTSIASPGALVSVKGGASLTLNVTLAFLQRWREFSMCSLEVTGAARVVFPPSLSPTKERKIDQHYVGLKLTGVSASAVPAGLFSGKLAAGLLLNNTSVGLLPAGLFSGVPALHSLHIVNSTVGVMEGPLGNAMLHTKMWQEEEEPVKVVNSTVGLLSGGALHLKMERYQRATLQGLSLGRVASGAIQVEGGEMVMEKCAAARVEAAAILLAKKARLLLRDNWLALQPHALTQIPCSQEGHRMYDNHFFVLLNGTAIPVSLTTNQTAAPPGAQLKEEIAERERLTAILSTVIHPTCITSNLAPLPTLSPLPAWSLLTPTKMVEFVLIGLFVGLIMGGLILLCYKCYNRRRRQPRCDEPLVVQPVVMSQIPQDPIYEECLPPPLPALPPPSCREECSASIVKNEFGKNTVENEYLVMDTPQQRHPRDIHTHLPPVANVAFPAPLNH
ncbi:hypothetical protein E2C01_017248 [Portunus trituberculatus]|uniref:Uncharacterized protein n=2 Tax=Portunus trituberculatus TaxID=210409 RepID=A0A5B7DR51_PORTR|nr:hypothetical protein [Portunus trituberculatus]